MLVKILHRTSVRRTYVCTLAPATQNMVFHDYWFYFAFSAFLKAGMGRRAQGRRLHAARSDATPPHATAASPLRRTKQVLGSSPHAARRRPSSFGRLSARGLAGPAVAHTRPQGHALGISSCLNIVYHIRSSCTTISRKIPAKKLPAERTRLIQLSITFPFGCCCLLFRGRRCAFSAKCRRSGPSPRGKTRHLGEPSPFLEGIPL